MKFTTISKLRQVGNSTGLILNASDLESINVEEGDEVFVQVRKVPSKQDLLQHVWDELNEKELAKLTKAAEKEEDYGPTGHCIYAAGSPLRFSSDFEELNPRTVVSTTSASITD